MATSPPKQRSKNVPVQHAMRVELERYKLLVDSIEDYAIFLMDTTGHIASWNKGAERFKGYTADEIIGKHFSAFYREQDIEAHKPERELTLALKFGRVEDEDWRVRKDGTQFWANVVITALHDSNGVHVGFAKVTRDLTERKQHEDELRRANTMLRQQQRELEQLNISKDEFISLASHQLRTPATVVKQLLGMMLEGLSGEIPLHLRDVIAKAYASNERQIHVVNSLLKVAQIDAGKVVLRKSNTDIHKMLSTIVDSHKEVFARRAQAVELDLPSTLSHALIDGEHMSTAVENLIDNASKYTPYAGKITVSARTTAMTLKIFVADTGVGIAEEDQSKLFEKFVRIPNHLSQQTTGSGLGLYWVNKVVTLHGGTIDVRSVVGKGTRFVITLPMGQAGA